MRLRRFAHWGHLLLAGVLMLAVWVLLVWVGSRPALKMLVDLSPQGRGTVDPVTVELLDELAAQDVKVEFHTFFLRDMVAQDLVEQQRQRILARLRDLTAMLLQQYEYHGNGAVRVFHHEQYGDIAATREAIQRFGGVDDDIVVVVVQQPGRGERHRKISLEGDLGVVDWPHMGAESPLPGAQRTVPVLADYKGEEGLSSALKGLLVQGVPRIYFLNGNSPDLQWGTVGSGYGALRRLLLESGFEVQDLDLSNPARPAAVPPDASLVAVLEPRREFADREVRALHDYVRRGGRLFLNYSYSVVDGWNPDGGELGRLLGFEIGPEPVFHRIPDPRAGPSVLGMDGDRRVGKLDLGVNPNHPITRRIALGRTALQFDAARPIELRRDAPAGLRREPLLGTGPQAWLGKRPPGDPDHYRAPQSPSAHGRYTVGVVIEVDAGAAEGDAAEGDAAEGGAAGDGAADGHVVVASGVFANNLGIEINGPLVLNIFNWLAERRVLLDIKGSRYEARHLRMELPQYERAWWFLVVGVPGSLLVAGVAVFWRRRQQRPVRAAGALAAGGNA